ncbi:hypothetical protein Rsub_05013 [Raphidocelis subcapitata]|uniref:Uncharacterized protein n=1 Tax=Raphidocelis subcapitata TaxID=307507 RepID=A0A2V0NYD7_9CHLO|nr:hypothetical protein Rsub_05013 [Raphidocelis subcapitata]|eukprot:GBF92644.1 hypothetical protein Rsub_05013 [Raphidocelis subcapitata]
MAARAACLLVLAVLAASCQAAMITDRTLPTSGSVCIDRFNALIKAQYKDDAACADLIKAALSTTDPQKCPEGSRKAGSKVQKCMSKTPAASTAWVDFVRSCEVMNVANRAGEAEAATERKPSCMPDFAGVDAFRAYVGGAAASGAAGRSAWMAGAAAAAAAVAAALAL